MKFVPLSCRSSGVAFESTGTGAEATKSDRVDKTSDAGLMRPNNMARGRPRAL